MRERRITKNKYLLLMIAMLIAMFALSGCRTRITNNSEVSNVHYDEDGFLSETYQMRRDELGLSTAERPILPDLGAPETEDDEFDNSEDENALQNYEPEPEPEPYVEPPQTNTNTNTNTSPSNRTSTSTTTRPTSRRSSSTTTNTEIAITFNPGKEGAITGKKAGETLVKNVKKNSNITPPDATREGYELTEWKSSDGKTSIKPGASAKVAAKTTFTAQWMEKKPDTWTITIDTDGGSAIDATTVEKGQKYKLPNAPTKTDYNFKAWLVGETEYAPGDEIDISADTSIKALWDPTTEKMWKDALKAEVDGDKIAEVLFIMGDDNDSNFVADCKAALAKGDEEPKYVVAFAKTKEIDKKIEELDNAKNDDGTAKYEGMTIIVISDTAKEAEYKLVYQIKLMTLLHSDSELDASKAAQELKKMSDDGEIMIKTKEQGATEE